MWESRSSPLFSREFQEIGTLFFFYQQKSYAVNPGPPANYRGGVKSFHFGSLLYSTVHLNLNCSLVFLVKSFFSVLSSPERTKVPGTRALESLTPRLTLLQGNIPRSSLACRYKPFCRVQGAAERCCQRAQRKLACKLHSECSTFKPKATHCVRQF